jgi:3'-phosphoadenosine 5'-phosphosulfate sulfotransferase
MSDDIKDIVIPILKNVQADIASLKMDVSVLKESVRRIDSRMQAMSSYMAGFHSSLSWLEDEYNVLKGRVEGLEDNDDNHPNK